VTGWLYAGAVVIGGANFLAVRFSNRELDPMWGAGLRFTVAALIFLAIALVLQLSWPRGRQLGLTLLYGLLAFAAFYALMYWALVRVAAGVSTVVMAVVPLVTVLLAAAQGMERLDPRALIGSVLSLGGIAWMTLGPTDVDLPLPALFAMLGAALSVGQSVIVSKRISASHPVVTNTLAMGVGAIFLLALSAMLGEDWALPTMPEVVWSLVYLVTIGSVGLFVLILMVIRRWPASVTSYMFVLFPVVSARGAARRRGDNRQRRHRGGHRDGRGLAGRLLQDRPGEVRRPGGRRHRLNARRPPWRRRFRDHMVYHMVVARREVLVQLDDDLVERLDKLAARDSVSRSELLRQGALAVLRADEWAMADEQLIEAYTKHPPDPLLLAASERMAAETAPEW
jgi:drug/metabolite transporter (DMT)-like permease